MPRAGRMRMKKRKAWLGIAWFSLTAAMSFGAAASDRRLIEAVKRTDVKTVRSLLAHHIDLNATEPDGSTALHVAAQRDNLEIAGLLIDAGANVTAATRYNITP